METRRLKSGQLPLIWKWPADAVEREKMNKLEQLDHQIRGMRLSALARGQLTRADKKLLAYVGLNGVLTRVINEVSELSQAYKQAKWPGVVEALARMGHVASKVPGFRRLIFALKEAYWFSLLNWRLDKCEYGDHKPGWYYVRSPIGRPPEACYIHARPARQHRWENSPSRKRGSKKSK